MGKKPKVSLKDFLKTRKQWHARSCAVCEHVYRPNIDEALRDSATNQAIADWLQSEDSALSAATIRRHRIANHHIPAVPAKQSR